jgi:hypothetical protein
MDKKQVRYLRKKKKRQRGNTCEKVQYPLGKGIARGDKGVHANNFSTLIVVQRFFLFLFGGGGLRTRE